MNVYEELLADIPEEYEVYEVPLKDTLSLDGIAKGNVILIDENLSTVEKRCILAEEHAHCQYTVGNIIDITNSRHLKQEIIARQKSYEVLVPLEELVKAKMHALNEPYEIAEFLNVTEDIFVASISYYKSKYGTEPVKIDGAVIYFFPYLDIYI